MITSFYFSSVENISNNEFLTGIGGSLPIDPICQITGFEKEQVQQIIESLCA